MSGDEGSETHGSNGDIFENFRSFLVGLLGEIESPNARMLASHSAIWGALCASRLAPEPDYVLIGKLTILEQMMRLYGMEALEKISFEVVSSAPMVKPVFH